MGEKLYKVKFILPDGQLVKLQCRDTELFEHIKERIWKKKEMTVDKKNFAFKLKHFPRLFVDHETFKRLVAVYGPGAEKIEALVVKKDAESDERNKDLITARAKEGDTPIQGYLDLMSGLSESATPTRRYFVLKMDPKVGPTLLYYASENAFYQREAPVTSLSVGNCQALKVDGLKFTFQFIRMEDGGKTGKYIFRADGDTPFKMWLHAVRLMNLNLTKLRGTASSVWVPDSAVTKCMRCDQKFTLMKRKHHCRGCGAVVCAECSGYKLMLAGQDENARVCKPCYKDHRKEQKASSPTKGDDDDDKDTSYPQSPSSKYDPPSKGPGSGADELRNQVRSSMAPKGVEGYMEKQSVKGLKPWQIRYFVLDEKGKRLLYYKDKKDRLTGAIGQIELKDVKECFHCKDDRCRFDIVSSRKIYPMKTQTPAASSRWVTAINRTIRGLAVPIEQTSTVKRITTRDATLSPLTQRREVSKPILLEGMLKKRHPKSSRLFISWQDRYFILSQAAKTMTYFKKNPNVDKDEKALGTIDLRDIAQCKTDFTDRKLPQFNIWMKTGRQYCICCSKETEATQWVKAINQCLAALEPEGGGRAASPVRPLAPRPTGKLASRDIGWPQLSLNLDVPSLIPIILRVLRFVGQDDLPQCVVICKLWRVITEEIIGGDLEDEEMGDGEVDGEASGEEDIPGPPDEDDESDDFPAVVIDNGAFTVRAGFAGDQAPKLIVAQASTSLVDPRASGTGVDSKTQGVALESLNHFTDSKSTWVQLEKTWKNLFNQMKAEPNTRKVMVTQPILAPIFVGQNMQKILFEKFKAPAAHLATAPILVAYSYGVFTGLVIDIGHTSAQVCPIVEGYLKEAAVRRSPHLGGEALTRRMYKYLEFTNLKKMPLVEGLEIARKLKEKYCFCVKDPDNFNLVLKDPKCKVDYTLPTKEIITITKALPSIGEMYFDPRKAAGDKDDSIKGIQELIEDSINASEMDTRTPLLQNILLSGGGTLMRGFVERLDLELKKQLPHAADSIRIHADKDRQNSVWRGASVLANLDVFQRKWSKREEYLAAR